MNKVSKVGFKSIKIERKMGIIHLDMFIEKYIYSLELYHLLLASAERVDTTWAQASTVASGNNLVAFACQFSFFFILITGVFMSPFVLLIYSVLVSFTIIYFSLSQTYRGRVEMDLN